MSTQRLAVGAETDPLLERAERHVRELINEQSALRKVATLVAREPTPDQLFAAVAEQVARVLDVPHVRLVRYESEGSVIVGGFSEAPDEPFSIGSRWPLDSPGVTAMVRQTGRPARVEDYTLMTGEIAAAARSAGMRSAVASPIVVGSRLWGAMVALSPRQEPFPVDTESRLADFTELVATAIVNAESRAALARLADEQAALRCVATIAARESSPVEVFRAVAQEAARVSETDAVGILRFGPDGSATLVAQSETPWDPPPLGTSFTLEGENVVAEVHRTGEAARMNDWSTATGSVAAMAHVLGVRSAVATPIVVEGSLWGTLIAATSRPEPLPEDTELRIGEFTDLVATAIATAESREALARLAAEQAALRRVAVLVAQAVPPGDLFAAVSDELEGLFRLVGDGTNAAVVRFDPGPEFVAVGVSSGWEKVVGGARWRPKDLFATTRVFRTGRAARVDAHELAEAGGPDAEFLQRHGLLSQVASPIVVEGRLWGAVNVNAREPMAVDTENRLERFGELVATAIANVEAREAFAGLVDEQAALRRVATLVAGGTGADELFAAVADEVQQLLGADASAIVRFEDNETVVTVGTHGGTYVPGTRSELDPHFVVASVRGTRRAARFDTDDPAAVDMPTIVRDWGVRSAVASPIVVEGELWGAIVVASRRSLPDQSEERLGDFTDLVASAIASSESRDALARLAREQAALRRVATLVAEGAAPSELFAGVANEVAAVVGVSSASVSRFLPQGHSVVLASLNDPGFPVGSRWPPDEGTLNAAILETGRPVRIDQSAMSGAIAEASRVSGVRSVVGVPIVVQGSVWGMVAVGRQRSDEPLPAETEVRLTDFTELIATAISNAEARDSERRLAEEQAALRRVATLVAQGVPSAELFAGVTTEVARVFSDVDPTLIASVIRFDPGPEGVLVGASRAYEQEPLGTRWAPKDLYVSTRVLRTGFSARVDETDLDAVGGPDADVLRLRGFLYQVGSPVVVEGSLWGAMCLNSKHELPPDTDQRLESFTELVATAIANAESRIAVAQLAEEQAALRRVATLVAKDVAPAEIFEAVSVEVDRVFFRPDDATLDVAGVVRFEPGPELAVVGVSKKVEAVPLGARFPPDELFAPTHVLRRGCSARISAEDLDVAGTEVADFLRHHGYLSQVASPIVVDGYCWGAVSVNSRTDLPPDTEERLEKFTEIVATAIANAESREAKAVLTEEQAALRRVAMLVARDAPSTEVFESVATEVGKLLNTDVTVVGRYDGDGAATAIGSWSASGGGVPVGTRSAIGGHNVLTIVAETGRPARVDGYDDASGEAAEIARRYGWSSSIAAPIAVEDRLWGVMLVATERPELFPVAAEERLAEFTDLVATAVANTEARHTLERVANEQAALRRVATLVAGSAQPNEVFWAVSEEVGRLFGTELAAVGRFEADGQEIDLVVAGRRQERWAVSDFLASSEVLRTGRSARADAACWESAEGKTAERLRSLSIVSTVSTPIVVEGELWGVMLVASTDEPLPADTEERLEKFTELVATAIANAEGKSELAASRRRIVAASDDARRRIERNLHDGTQQRLVSLGLAVRAAESNLAPERQDVQDQLSRVANGLAEAIEDLQEISRGIHPAILSRGGLGPALQTLAHRSAIPVDLNITTDVRLAEPIEVAAYFVASEALANAAKHSDATRIDVSLEQRYDNLLLSVRDDGVGGADAARGSGIVGLHDRVEALGGSLRVDSRPGDGTKIVARLPLDLESERPL